MTSEYKEFYEKEKILLLLMNLVILLRMIVREGLHENTHMNTTTVVIIICNNSTLFCSQNKLLFCLLCWVATYLLVMSPKTHR